MARSPSSRSAADARVPDLIVNADDFGLTPGVSLGVLRGHRDGIISSTSAMVLTPSFDDHAAALRDSGLPTGAHLTAVGAHPPMLSATEIPSLVGRTGSFLPTWREFLARCAVGRVDPADVRREFDAQIEKLVANGLPPSHLDTHQNLHLWPTIATTLVELALAWGIRAMRCPGTRRRHPLAIGVRGFSALLDQRLRAAAVSTADRSIGLDEIRPDRPEGLVALLGDLARGADGCTELVAHVGARPDPLLAGYPSRFDHAEQLAVVCHPLVRRAVIEHGLVLGSFTDLTGATGGGSRAAAGLR